MQRASWGKRGHGALTLELHSIPRVRAALNWGLSSRGPGLAGLGTHEARCALWRWFGCGWLPEVLAIIGLWHV